MRTPGLILCSSPRSGSTLLCDLLSATGRAGRPASYYRRESVEDYAEQFGISAYDHPTAESFERAYLAGVLAAGRDASGRFALRLMAENRPELAARLALLFPDCVTDAERFAAAFGPCVHVHLCRVDKVAEAISLLRAEQTGLWHRRADGSERERTAPPRPAVYDAPRIAEHLAALTAFERSWNDWFTANGIEPLRLSYEDLAADPQRALARLLAALDEDPALARTISPRTARLADAESREWAARFIADAG
ncbi:MAG: sulfotransferase [Devosia sp.]|nr:sulfotransferase [Devosia sp.]